MTVLAPRQQRHRTRVRKRDHDDHPRENHRARRLRPDDRIWFVQRRWQTGWIESVGDLRAGLERRLGVKLIQRSTRTLGLTAEGQADYERVAPLLRAIEDAEDMAQAAATARGPIRVSVPGQALSGVHS